MHINTNETPEERAGVIVKGVVSFLHQSVIFIQGMVDRGELLPGSEAVKELERLVRADNIFHKRSSNE